MLKERSEIPSNIIAEKTGANITNKSRRCLTLKVNIQCISNMIVIIKFMTQKIFYIK